jgi:hypothetical protein
MTITGITPLVCNADTHSVAPNRIAAMADTTGGGLAPHNPLGPIAGIAAHPMKPGIIHTRNAVLADGTIVDW